MVFALCWPDEHTFAVGASRRRGWFVVEGVKSTVSDFLAPYSVGGLPQLRSAQTLAGLPLALVANACNSSCFLYNIDIEIRFKLSPDNIRDLYLELHTEKHEVSAEEYGRLVQRLDPSQLNKQRVVGIARRAQEEHARNAQEQLRADERGTLEDNAEVGISRRDGGGRNGSKLDQHGTNDYTRTQALIQAQA
jgi:hypothetical protein